MVVKPPKEEERNKFVALPEIFLSGSSKDQHPQCESNNNMIIEELDSSTKRRVSALLQQVPVSDALSQFNCYPAIEP